MENTEKIIGEWLEEKRIEKGLTLQTVADSLGFSKSTIHCWEQAKRSISAKDFMDYCHYLGADPQECVERVRKGG